MISVLVPYRSGEPYRDRAWEWVKERWRRVPGVELVVEIAPDGAHPGEFNHPLAINRAAERASGDVFVVADADTAFDSVWVLDAAQKVGGGEARWIMPRYYDKIDRASSEHILGLPPQAPIGAPFHEYGTEWRGDSVSWSGLVVVPREAFEIVGGYDERIAWWGADDIAFGLTMETLWGKVTRLEGVAMHLWHPQPKSETYGHERHAAQQALVDRYIAAVGDPEAIREVRFEKDPAAA